MSLYELDPSPPPRDRFQTLIVGSLLILALLVVVGGLLLLDRSDLAFAPTPTPTATDAPPIPPTADFRATRVVEDLITQEAYPVVIALNATQQPTPASTVPLFATVDAAEEQGSDELPPMPAQPETPEGTVTVSLSLPIVSAGSTPESIIPSPTWTPTNPPLPTATPTAAPVTPTITQAPPTPSPTTTTTPLPTPYIVERLLARVEKAGVKQRRGPGDRYEDDGEFEVDEIWLLGRSPSGEWVYATQDDNWGWLRQVDARPRDNELPENAPEGANPDDVRWLEIEPPPSGQEPPIATPIPANDFPLVRVNRSNQNRVNRIPLAPYNSFWPEGGYDAGQPFSSPVVVAGNSVIAANNDHHIYAVDRQGGNQKWRQEIGNRISQSPAIQNSDVFAIDESGIVYAVRESGVQWTRSTDMAPSAALTIARDWLYAVGKAGETPRLSWIRLDNGDIQQTFDREGQVFFLPAIGDQMIYVVGDRVLALESSVIEVEDEPNQAQQIWEYTDFNNASPTTPPVYASPGVRALAELYVGTSSGRIYLLDANTGIFLDWYEGDRAVRSLAIDATRLYAAGDDRLRAYSRDTRELLWETDLAARLVSGPITDDDYVIVFLEDGTVEIYNALNGNALNGNEGGYHILGDPQGGAISNPYLFSASSDNKMYGLEGQN